jgi:hypothetical protein
LDYKGTTFVHSPEATWTTMKLYKKSHTPQTLARHLRRIPDTTRLHRHSPDMITFWS